MLTHLAHHFNYHDTTEERPQPILIGCQCAGRCASGPSWCSYTRRPWITNQEATTSILVYGEVVEYAMGFADYTRRLAHLQTLLNTISAYPVTYAIMERYATLRRVMRHIPPGLIGDVDTLIAATALEHGLTVVTTDTDFMRVPGLIPRVLPLNTLK